MTSWEQRSLNVRVGCHLVTTNLNIRQIREMYSLREQVYVHELGWIKSTGTNIGEIDEFDGSSKHFCVLDHHSHVIATVRLTPSNRRWMLDSYFRHLLPSFPTDRYFSNVSEISRLAVSPSYRNVVLDQGVTVAELLYQTLFRFSMLNELQSSYAVVSAQVFRHLLRCGIPCAAVSPQHAMPDGVVALVIKINWHAYELLARFDAIAVNQLAASALLHADETGINIARARRGARLPDHVPATPTNARRLTQHTPENADARNDPKRVICWSA